MWNWPKNSEHFKYELFSILGEMIEQKENTNPSCAVDAIEDLKYSLSLSVTATENHCRNWIIDDATFSDCDIEYQDTIYEFVKKVNQILSEEQWSFE